MSPVLWFFFFTVVGVVSLTAVLVVRKLVSVADWETVPATVLDSGIREVVGAGGTADRTIQDDFGYRVEVRYSYRFGGEEFTSDTVTRGAPPVFPLRARAEVLLNDYPAGSRVDAFVNPAQPSQAVLVTTRGVHSAAWVFLFFFVGFILTIFGLFFLTQAGLFKPFEYFQGIGGS